MAGMFTAYQPHIWPSQREPVEVALVSKNELFRAKVIIDEVLEFLTILFISLQNGPCYEA